jgi:transcriptional regulator with XRE-family HTH domain
MDTGQFSEKLRATRVDCGYTLRKFAEKIDVSPSYQSAVERGEVPPPATDVIRRIANVLGQNFDDWLRLAGPARRLEDMWNRAQNPVVSEHVYTVLSFSPEELERVSPRALRQFLSEQTQIQEGGND